MLHELKDEIRLVNIQWDLCLEPSGHVAISKVR